MLGLIVWESLVELLEITKSSKCGNDDNNWTKHEQQDHLHLLILPFLKAGYKHSEIFEITGGLVKSKDCTKASNKISRKSETL